MSDNRVLVVVGSSHVGGKSTKLADAFMGAFNAHGVQPDYVHLANCSIADCINCSACFETGECVFDDDWEALATKLATADLTLIVAPIYFAGPCANLKAMLDRCQMFFARKYVLEDSVPPKRPAHLVVVGDGGDPFGSQPLELICTSALNCANVRIEGRVHRFIGDEYDFARLPEIVDTMLEDLEAGQRE